MNGRLTQDASEAFAAYEAQRAFRDLERIRWAKAQPPKIVGTWAPVLTEQQRLAQEKLIDDGTIPF
jgi:ATP-dependent helicase/DNAse subunit B